MAMKRSILGLFLLFFLIFIIGPSAVFFGVLSRHYSATLLDSAQAKADYALRQISEQFTREIDELVYLLSVVNANNNNQLLRLAARAVLPGEPLTTVSQLESQLSLITSYNRNIASIAFFRKGGGMYLFKRQLTDDERALRASPWYQECLKRPGEPQFALLPRSMVYSGTSDQYLLIAQHPRAHDNASEIETVAILVAPAVFAPIYARLDQAEIGELLLVNSDGAVLTGPGVAEGWDPKRLRDLIHGVDNSILDRDARGNRVLLTHLNLQRTNWHLVNIVQLDRLTGASQTTVSLATLVYLAFMVLFLLMCTLIYRRILAPIRALEGSMARVEQGQFDIQLKTEWHSREFNALTHAFIRMTNQIQQLILGIDQREARKRELEIEALQYQINPHFMKNTLNAIRLLAMMANNKNIEEVAESLSRIVTTTLEKTGATCTLNEEIDLLKSYAHIMDVRYGNQISIRFDVPEHLQRCVVLKMLLQPIVENAIYHGLSGREMAGDIYVGAVAQDGFLNIEILDNGGGMSKQRIQAVLRGEGEQGMRTNRIGLTNVIDRIRLNYGDDFGLTIESEMNHFTRVKLRLPLIFEEESHENHPGCG